MTQAEHDELREILQELERLGWHFRIIDGVMEVPTGHMLPLERIDRLVGAGVLREIIESEVEVRGMWAKYMTRVALHRRPTLLEVARAVLEVAKGGGC